MWKVITEEDIRCRECSHRIAAKSACLSQLPQQLPEGVRRQSFENFCVTCSVCESKGKVVSCYGRRLDHWYTRQEVAPEGTHCLQCGSDLPEDTRTYMHDFYAWPEIEAIPGNSQFEDVATAGEAGAAGVASARFASQVRAGAWHNLPPQMKWMFRIRGLGGKRGFRSEAMAQRLYETIPQTIRNQGPSAVRNFLKGRSASHIKSVANAPNLARQPGNIVWENVRTNVTRGSLNMTGAEIAKANSAVSKAAVRAAVKGAAKGGILTALVEAPIAGAENVLHWRRGRKSGKQAVKDTAMSATSAGAMGVGITAAFAGIAKGVAMAGVGLSLVPLGTPLMVAGGGMLVSSAIHRIYKAAKRDLPLDQFRAFFCKDRDCRLQYAQAMVAATPTVSDEERDA